MRHLTRLIAVPFLLLTVTGCESTSKYALDDPDYAAKYDVPYGDDKLTRMSKQMVDARHVVGKGGVFLGTGFGYDGDAQLGGEIGVFGYPASWLSVRASLMGVASSAAEDGFTGGSIGLRVQPPSRLAPFVGVGGYAGYSEQENQCDCDDRIDGGFTSVYPEVGAHFWINGRTRLTASAQYWINSEGREADLWYYGVSLGLLAW